MISGIRGMVLRAQPDGRAQIRLDIGGQPGPLTLEVFMPVSDAAQLSPGDEADLSTHLYFSTKADMLRLYAFSSPEARALFTMLIGASGIGPAVALSLLDLGSANLAAAIRDSDERTLTKASGVGPKLAKKIILELADKVAKEFSALASLPSRTHPPVSALPRPVEDALNAVAALGFPRQRAEQALDAVRAEYDGDETVLLIRKMLAQLASG
jgi:Holliday junction DNA helicase RuvA